MAREKKETSSFFLFFCLLLAFNKVEINIKHVRTSEILEETEKERKYSNTYIDKRRDQTRKMKKKKKKG